MEGGRRRRKKYVSVFLHNKIRQKDPENPGMQNTNTHITKTTLFLLANQNSDMEKLFSPKQP